MNGKGDKQRKSQVTHQQERDEWERLFPKKVKTHADVIVTDTRPLCWKGGVLSLKT